MYKTDFTEMAKIKEHPIKNFTTLHTIIMNYPYEIRGALILIIINLTFTLINACT
jgi:hypothetical protein